MRTPVEWARYRIGRIPRKLRDARKTATWLSRDVRNGLRRWWELGVCKRPITDLIRYERRIDSQHGQDGILEALFTKIGTTDKRFVEFGSGTTRECNTIYLARWKGWRGLWMDSTYLDTDGNDYWIWKAITRYRPRVVSIEYNAELPPHVSRTIPYDPHFRWDGETDYFGASLLALKKLGEHKGHTLLGCDSAGADAFFVRQELAQRHFVVRDVTSVYRRPVWFDGRGIAHNASRAMVDV